MEEAMEPVREYKKPRKARSNSRSQDELQKASEKIEAFEAEMKETLSQRDFSKALARFLPSCIRPKNSFEHLGRTSKIC